MSLPGEPIPPGRPDHPDFWVLSDLILQLDGQATEGGRDVGDLAAEVIDPRSLSYLALNRIVMAERATGREFDMRQQITAAALYMEAFIMGARYAQRSASPFVKP